MSDRNDLLANLDNIDPTFLADLRASDRACEAVARWARKKHGIAVAVSPLFERPDSSKADEYADAGDLLFLQRVEVKHRKEFDFTSAETFPYEDAIVDKVASFDRARPTPWRYFLCNKDLTGALVVDVHKTRHAWTKRSVWSEVRGRNVLNYYCPVSLLVYRDLRLP